MIYNDEFEYIFIWEGVQNLKHQSLLIINRKRSMLFGSATSLEWYPEVHY